MSEDNSSSNSKGDEAMMEAAFGLIKLAVIVLAIPTMLLGNVWAGMYLDRREGRVTRLLIATFMLFGAVYFFFGLPGGIIETGRVVFGRRSLSEPTTYEWMQGLWQGLFFENLWTSFQGFYLWVVGKPKKGKFQLLEFYEFVKVALYFASAAVPLVAAFFIYKRSWVKVGFYRSLRAVFTALVWPVTFLPIKLVQSGWIALSCAVLLTQAAAGMGASVFFAWLFEGKYYFSGYYVPVTAFYLTLGSVYAIYRLVFQGIATVQAIRDLQNPDLIQVGEDLERGTRVALTIEQLQHHLHVLGASGFGKSVFLSHLYRHHIRNGLGLIFVDLKADSDTVAEITTFCKNADRLKDLRILDLSRPNLSLSYNPCKRGNPTEIKDKLVGAFVWESEYYKNAAQSFLLTILRALVWLRDNRKIEFTLDDIYGATLSPDALITLGMSLNEGVAPMGMREDIHDQATYLRSKENWKELHGLRTQLKMLLDSEFGESLRSEKCGLDLFEAISQQLIVYVLLDSQTYGETAKILGKLILQDLKSCSGEIVTKTSKADRTHCTIIVDEFADLATEQFVGFLNRARGSKLGVVIAHQEIADLTAVSQAMRDQVMTNTSTTVSFIQKSPESAERISNLAGTRQTTARTRQIVEEPGIFWNDRRYSGVESERETYEYNIHPDTIKCLPRGQCVIVGKIPYAWHARVAVYAPAQLDTEEGMATSVRVSEVLGTIKEALEKKPMGMRSLQLRKRSREFGEGTKEVPQTSQTSGSPGLRTSGVATESMPIVADADDRF